MTTIEEIQLLERDRARIERRIAELREEQRQAHAAFMRVVEIQRKEQAKQRRENWRLLTPMSMDMHVKYPEQNCQDGRQ